MCVIQIKGVFFTWLSRRVSFDCYNDGYDKEKGKYVNNYFWKNNPPEMSSEYK